jgi:hypothetical protein
MVVIVKISESGAKKVDLLQFLLRYDASDDSTCG